MASQMDLFTYFKKTGSGIKRPSVNLNDQRNIAEPDHTAATKQNKRDADRAYDAHVRVRSFLPGWLEGRPWLKYVPKTDDVIPADAKPQVNPQQAPMPMASCTVWFVRQTHMGMLIPTAHFLRGPHHFTSLQLQNIRTLWDTRER